MSASQSQSAKGSRAWDPFRTFDVSPEQKKAIEQRAQMKLALKKEWQMKVSNPYRGPTGFIFDPAVQRFLSMRFDHWQHFKPNASTGLFGFVAGLAPFLFTWWWISTTRSKYEKELRSGKIAYEDRLWKNV